MLADLVKTLLDAGEKKKQAEVEAAGVVRVCPLPGGRYMLLQGENVEERDARESRHEIVELTDFADKVQQVSESHHGAVFVGRNKVCMCYEDHDRQILVASGFDLTGAFNGVGELSEYMEPKAMLLVMARDYRDCFASLAVFNQFKTVFQNVSSVRNANRQTGNANANYGQTVQAQMTSAAGSLDAFEFLTLNVEVFDQSLCCTRQPIELVMDLDPSSLTVGFDVSEDAISAAKRAARTQIAAALRERLKDLGVDVPVYLGDNTIGFESVSEKVFSATAGKVTTAG